MRKNKILIDTSNGWDLDVPSAGTSTRLVLFVANNTFTLYVSCAFKTSYTIND